MSSLYRAIRLFYMKAYSLPELVKTKAARQKRYAREHYTKLGKTPAEWKIEESINWTNEKVATIAQTLLEEETSNINLDSGIYPDEWFTFLFCSRPNILGLGVCKSYCVANRRQLEKPAYAGGKSLLLNGTSSDASEDISSLSLRKRFGDYKSSTGKKHKVDDKDDKDTKSVIQERIVKIQFEEKPNSLANNKMKEKIAAIRERISLSEQLGRDATPLILQLDNMLEKYIDTLTEETV